MEDNVKLLLVSDDEIIQNQILNIIGEHIQTQIVNPVDVVREINREAKDIVIFIQPTNDIAVENIQFIKTASPSTLVIFIAKTSDFTLLRSITKAGATEFFVFPEEQGVFAAKLPTIIKNYELNKDNQDTTFFTFVRGSGQIISFFSGSGGTGKTVLASTFAQTLKLESTAEVILIDLNLQFGGIETVISINSNRSIADLAPVIRELNEGHIRNVSQTESFSKMDVLISPCDAEVAETLSEDFITKLLRTCRRSFDFVIIDLPSFINNQVVTALEESDKIYYVLVPDTPSLKVLKQFEELSIRLGIELKSRMSIILNHVGKENEVQEKDLKDIVRFPIEAKIRRDIKGLQPFVNKGEPVRKMAKERRLIPFAKDIRKWAHSVLK
ncbi:AAA family ATPase [Caldifermentibacillus hisashii]|uniref:AAA family ATPase n=1 Tax=Caldifermentibacillus hisashii TaxID=996558 RepID=UPI000BA2F44C|nr:AAA family ATPase [Caldifermentibacillus hisashii]PAC31868.1 pilus assembly protein CpaE [Caldifermentibacillus hisashii]